MVTSSESLLPTIGIDLGTTNSCVGVWANNKVNIVRNKQGYNTTPSVVSFKNNDRLVGDAAKNHLISNAKNTIFEAKRLIGRKFSDREVQDDVALYPFKVESSGGLEDTPLINVTYRGAEKKFHAEQISAFILEEMKAIAEDFLGGGQTICDAVITVPAYFNDSQR